MDYVPREAYIGRIAPFVGNSNAKVVTGSDAAANPP